MSTQALPLGQVSEHLKEVDSTNSWLKKMLSETNLPEGFCVSTDYQTSGRGQYGKSWEGQRGENLLLSVLLRPSFTAPEESYRLTLSVCLAVCDLLESFLPSVQIKWPNDVLVGSQKISGALLESSTVGQKLEYCIAGVGINVNQDSFEDSRATSLYRLTGQNYDLSTLRRAFLGKLSLRYHELHSREGALRQQRAMAQRLYGAQEAVPIYWRGATMWVNCVGVKQDGQLLLRLPSGEMRYFRHREMEFVFP